MKLTTQKRKDAFGNIMFRVFFDVDGKIVEGWGKTADEAMRELRKKCRKIQKYLKNAVKTPQK